MARTGKAILLATAVAGTLDILSAFFFSTQSPARILRYVASGPFGAWAADGGSLAAAVGLLVHFTIMAAMVTVFVLVAQRRPRLLRWPLLAGLAYGLLLYLIMYWIVMPLRFPDLFPVTEPIRIAKALFSHLILVGIPIALITRRYGVAGHAR
jgi:hypothetical protein